MKIKIWDKKSSINGVLAEKVLANNWNNVEDIILIEDDYGNITNIENCKILKAFLKCNNNLSPLEVGQAYVDYLQNQEEHSKKDMTTLEELKARNEELEACVLELAELIGNM